MARRLQPEDYNLTQVITTVNELVDGRSNNIGTLEDGHSVTLTPSAATTSVTFENASASSVILLSPRTANAAAEDWWIVSKANGSFVIGHANSATADRTFDFICSGG